MVLMRLLALATLLAGCLPKTAAVSAPPGATAAVAVVQSPMDSRSVVDAPELLVDTVRDRLDTRGLSPTVLGADDYADAFERRRSTTHRLSHLSDEVDGERFVALVETNARYFSQLNGRFRWEVDVVVSLAPDGAPAEATIDDFTVPVFLLFMHQGEREAVEAAASDIDRHLDRAISEFLGGLDTP